MASNFGHKTKTTPTRQHPRKLSTAEACACLYHCRALTMSLADLVRPEATDELPYNPDGPEWNMVHVTGHEAERSLTRQHILRLGLLTPASI